MVSQFTGRILSPESLFSVGWVRLSLSIAWIFTHLEKSGARSSATPVRFSACGHMAFDLPVPCHLKLADDDRHDESPCDGSQVSSSANFGGSLVWCSGVLLQVRHFSFIPLQRFQHVENCRKTSIEGLDTSLGPQWRKHFLAEETIKQNKAVGKVRWHLILHGTFTYVFFTGEGGFGSKMLGTKTNFIIDHIQHW